VVVFDVFVWNSFVQGLLASVAAGAILFVVSGLLIERWLKRRDERRYRDAVRKAVLEEVRKELEDNYAKATDLVATPGTAPAVLFDVNGWDFLSQERVLTALDSNTIDILVKTYNRLRGANAVHKIASEHFYGPTVTIVRFLIGLSQGAAQQKQVAEAAFKKAQDDYFNDLLNHTRELPQLLSAACGAVDFELKQLEPNTWAWKKVFAIRTPG
jgi:hypothetical protein